MNKYLYISLITLLSTLLILTIKVVYAFQDDEAPRLRSFFVYELYSPELLNRNSIIFTHNRPAILEKIAFCESTDKHFINGKIVKNYNTNGTVDVGRYQVNSIHFKNAKAMGIDVYTEKGNEEYALWLYETQGLTPWNSSKNCWKMLI